MDIYEELKKLNDLLNAKEIDFNEVFNFVRNIKDELKSLGIMMKTTKVNTFIKYTLELNVQLNYFNRKVDKKVIDGYINKCNNIVNLCLNFLENNAELYKTHKEFRDLLKQFHV